ncbi:MAG: AMP-binding protein, partial [Rhodobacteraceae bacterium]|nr:AMP-binding protein [Paracoccaceae bacterium]
MSILNESLANQIRGMGNARRDSGSSHGVPANGVSYVKGETDVGLDYITIPQLLRVAVSRHGARDAVIFADTGERRSYYDFDREIDALATGLLAMGLQKGDRLGLWSPNRYEWILTQFATARIGVIMVNINPAYRLNEVEYALNKVGCKTLVLAKSFKASDYLGMIRQLAPELENCEPGRLCAAKLPMLKNVIVMDDDPGPG